MKKRIFFLTCLILIFSFTVNAFASSEISNINSLTQYINTSMNNYISPITIKYANPKDINSTVKNNILNGAYLTDDYTAASYSEIAFSEKTDENDSSAVDLTITPTYVETKDEAAYVNTRAAQIVSSVIKPGMTDYQKVAALHDWVVSNVKYDTSLKEVSDYTALSDGKTVCRGYSMLLYKLLTNAGFNSHIVLGSVVEGFKFRHTAEGHAWNMVQLDGKWYFIDSTNDQLSTDSSTKFFLVSGNVLQSYGYRWKQAQYPSAPYNYGSSAKSETISKIIISRLSYSKTPVALKAAAVYSDGNYSIIDNSKIIWTSSNTDVAAVSSSGVVTFTGNAGNVTITASYGNIKSTTSTKVYYILGMTRINYSSNSQQIKIYKVYSNGDAVPVTSGVTWKSSNTAIVNIDSNGVLNFTGANGIAAIAGTYNGQTVSQMVIKYTIPDTMWYMYRRINR